ncbi:AMIN domain-containing protein, partial [bacterium]
MKRWAFHFIFYLALSIFLYDTVLAEPSETVSSYVLSDLQYEVYPEFSRIIFSSNDKIDFTSYELQAPYRIVIDLLGVSFCELQERIECDEGLVESIEIVKTPYAQKPQGLDEYFYAVDYIIITPRSDFPYTVSSAENGRIIALDIGTETPPGIRVSKVSLDEEDSFDISENQQLEAEKSLSAENRYLPKDDQLREDMSKIIDEHISLIDYIDIESTDDYMLVIISTNNEVLYSANRSYYPVFNIVIKPKTAIFTDLQEYIEFDTGYIKSLRIVRDKKVSTPKT